MSKILRLDLVVDDEDYEKLRKRYGGDNRITAAVGRLLKSFFLVSAYWASPQHHKKEEEDDE